MADDNQSFTIKVLKLADESYRIGHFRDASMIISKLLTLPNSSSCHDKISKFLMAYEIHYVSAIGNTYYDILRIKDYSCSQEVIDNNYKDLILELNPMLSKFMAFQRAVCIVNYAYKVLSDPMKRREYDNQLRIRIQEPKRKGKEVEVLQEQEEDDSD